MWNKIRDIFHRLMDKLIYGPSEIESFTDDEWCVIDTDENTDMFYKVAENFNIDSDLVTYILEPLNNHKIKDVQDVFNRIGIADETPNRWLTQLLERVVEVYEKTNPISDEEKERLAKDVIFKIVKILDESKPNDTESFLPPIEPIEPESPIDLPPPEPRSIKPGIWVANGHPGNTDLMYGWNPSAITCFYDYLQFNRVHAYKSDNPRTTVIIRFQHPKNWRDEPVISAKNYGREIAGKWDSIKNLDPYVYFANENNLHYENGDPNPANQHLFTTAGFYQKYADWVRMTADTIKNITPEMKLITPPFAFGHHEDGAPDDNGNIKEGWAGYDFLEQTIREYFDNILTGHYYWGDGTGRIPTRLYNNEVSKWYAFRWKKVLALFKSRYGIDAKMIIDEAGSFNAGHDLFINDVKYYSKECLSDERVLALTYFLWSDPTNSAGNLPNAWVQNMDNERLQKFTNQLKGLK